MRFAVALSMAVVATWTTALVAAIAYAFFAGWDASIRPPLLLAVAAGITVGVITYRRGEPDETGSA